MWIEQNTKLKLITRSGIRADAVDEVVLKKMKEAGFSWLSFGVEGGNDKPARLYQSLDFITIHDYQQISDEDRHLHERLDKPLLIEEAGKKDERDGWFRQNMDDWFNMGAAGYMGWGFMPSVNDNGDGDEEVGIDRAIHGDYDVVTKIWRDRAEALGPVPPFRA